MIVCCLFGVGVGSISVMGDMEIADDEADNPFWPEWYHRSGMFCEGHTFGFRDWFGHRSRSEPVNAITNIAYIALAIIAFRMSTR
jgi:hypothetical protein